MLHQIRSLRLCAPLPTRAFPHFHKAAQYSLRTPSVSTSTPAFIRAYIRTSMSGAATASSRPSPADIAAQAALSFDLRVATPADAADLAALASRTFSDTFQHLYPPEELATFLAETYNPDVLRTQIEDVNKYTVLVVSKDAPAQLCGYAMLHDGSVRTGEDPALAPHSFEIKRVYIDKPFHGSGAAHLLMTHVMEVVASKQRRHVWLGVYEDNVKAQKFYHKYGFEHVGEHVFLVGSTQDRDLLFELRQTSK